MNKATKYALSAIFKKAHKITKATIQAGETYAVNFGQVLKILRNTNKFVLKFWESSRGHRRIYIKDAQTEKEYGFINAADMKNLDFTEVDQSIIEELNARAEVKLWTDLTKKDFYERIDQVYRRCSSI